MLARDLRIVVKGPSCSTCQAKPFCLQSVCSGELCNTFKRAIRTKGPFQKGDLIYRTGMPFTTLYMIQRGSVKTQICTVNGVMEVTGFYLFGELLGVDAFACDTYPADAMALEECWVCELSYDQIKAMCNACTDFQQGLMTRLGRTLNSDVYQWALARNLKAKQKVAWFIFDLFKRTRVRYASDLRTIPLPMLKTDIANYLGLAPESLSRALLALEKEGMIVNEAKHIYLSDIQKAQSLSMI
ncbi:MAG: cyclic nucleotide-binding domain-containing protein [Candidatus Thiodiazotropha sp.]